MMSNALCPLVPSALAAASAPASAPGAILHDQRLLMALTGVGICVLAVWLVRCLANPARLTLRRTPARANTIGPVQLLVGAALWQLSGGVYALCKTWLLDPLAGDPAARAAMDTRCQIACGAIASVILLGIGLGIAARTFRRGLARGLGLSARRWFFDSLRGVVGYLAVLPACTGLLVATTFLFLALGVPIKMHVVLQNFASFPLEWKVLSIVSVVGVAPFAEEIFFRGLIQSMVRQYTGRPWVAILSASACFAAVHLNQPQAIPSLFALALALGYNYERTGRLYAPILIHAIFNAVNLAS